MIIAVTREHIAEGRRHNCFHCPVALAIRDALPRYFNYSVAVLPEHTFLRRAGSVTISKLEGAYLFPEHYNLPEIANDWALSYDSGAVVVPFAFELPLEGSRL